MSDDRFWYPLDGIWHGSVATKSSALHLGVESQGRFNKKIVSAACSDNFTLFDDGGYPEAEAAASGRQCKRCLRRIDGSSK